MESFPNKGRGLRGIQNSRSEPQRTWDSFVLAPSVFEASTEGTCICSGKVSVLLAEVGVEGSTSEQGMLGVVPPEESTPRRRGWPKKDTGKGEGIALKLSSMYTRLLRNLQRLLTGRGLWRLPVKEAENERGG